MYDKELALEILSQIYQASQTILERFKPIKSISDFTDSPAGMEKFDSICMLLSAIGEALKNLDKTTNKTLLPRYPQVDWKK
ncbi:MAG: antitoxin, partial [Deltaproteobacteria bacterium]|nr:antitoxin [Deltaproteobacteria bacterium]